MVRQAATDVGVHGMSQHQGVEGDMSLAPGGPASEDNREPNSFLTTPQGVPTPGPTTSAGFVAHASTLSRLGGGFVMLVGLLVLIGWNFDIAEWKGVYGGITMKANTAFSLLMGGASLLLLNSSEKSAFARGVGQVLASLLAVIGVITLSEHITGSSLAIDQILFVEEPGALATTSPGLMGITAASGFAMAGVALLMFYRRRAVFLSQALSIIVGLWAMLAIIGYAYQAEQLYGIARYSGIAFHTAVSLVVLSLGMLATRSDKGIVSIIGYEGAGGMMARRLVLTAILVPFVFGWLRLLLQRAGYVDLGFGTALLAVSLIITLAVIAWDSAKRVNTIRVQEAAESFERHRAEHSLAKRAGEQAALYEFTNSLHRSSSLTDIYESALDTIVNALACDRAAILLFDDAGVTRFASWRGLSDTYRQAVEGHSPWRRDDSNPQPICVNDIDAADSPVALKTVVKAEGVGAMVFIPLVVRGALIGRFMAYYNAPHVFTGEELNLTLTIARQVGFGVERKRGEDERRKAERARALLAGIVESSQDAIISKTLDGIVVSWNGAAQRLFEYTAEEMIGQPITIIIPIERIEEERLILNRLSRGERIEHFETVRVSKSGRRVDISLTISPVLNPNGEIIGASKIARDITERMRAEAELREWEQRFRILADASPMMVWMSGPDKSGHYFNRRWLDFTGRTMEQEIGDGWAEGVHPDDLRPCLDTYVKAFDARGEFEVEYRLRRLDGEYRWIFSHGVPLFAPPEEFVGYIGACIDITERKNSEQEREQLLNDAEDARAEAEAANRIKDEFLATLSHELRTPLNAIIGWSSMLAEKRLGEENFGRAIEAIYRNGQAQAKLVDDILDMSRIVSGNIRLEYRPVELVEVIKAAIDVVRPAAEAKQISLETRLDRNAGPVLGDAIRLQEVVWNLLSNAVKFTQPGGHVEVQLAVRGSQVEIVVSDNGPGISPEFLPHVFDRFRQADGSLTRKYKGLGLGLAIVRNLVELQGGVVFGESGGIGKGARFTVSLPAITGRVDPPIVQLREAVASERDDGIRVLAGLHLLVVDDEADARDMITMMLHQYGARVRAAASAQEALALLMEWRPDVLIADIEMPEINGYSFIRQLRLREAEKGCHLPAIALTAHAKVEDRLLALEAGFQIHVSKPVNTKELILAVATLGDRAHRSTKSRSSNERRGNRKPAASAS